MSKSESRNKTDHILVRVSPEEKLVIQNSAKLAGVSPPEYLRSTGLKRNLKSKVDLHVLNELRRLGGLQKHLFKKGDGVLSHEYAQVLMEIKSCIMRIGEAK